MERSGTQKARITRWFNHYQSNPLTIGVYMTTNFLDPIFYDVSDIPEDAPNKPLLRELYERENAQNERLWMFFTEMIESPGYKPMSAASIKPRTLRKKKKATSQQVDKPRAIDNPDSEEFEAGYKDFLATEFQS
tara:strand:+ start:2174 stop:2575 length:402 start_codon:yes stop_codon:yes gene_type:complete